MFQEADAFGTTVNPQDLSAWNVSGIGDTMPTDFNNSTGVITLPTAWQ